MTQPSLPYINVRQLPETPKAVEALVSFFTPTWNYFDGYTHPLVADHGEHTLAQIRKQIVEGLVPKNGYTIKNIINEGGHCFIEVNELTTIVFEIAKLRRGGRSMHVCINTIEGEYGMKDTINTIQKDREERAKNKALVESAKNKLTPEEWRAIQS